MSKPSTLQRYLTILAIYGGVLLVGISLTLFPSAGPIFKDPDLHNLSSSQFGSIFTPQTIMAIIGALSAATIAGRFGMKRLLQIGMVLTGAALLVAVATQGVIGSGNLSFYLLWVATALLGVGFAISLTALNA